MNWKDKTIFIGDNLDIMRGMNFPYRNFTIDHKIPRSKGGTDDFDNLWLLCNACNSTKGTGTIAEMRVKLKGIGL